SKEKLVGQTAGQPSINQLQQMHSETPPALPSLLCRMGGREGSVPPAAASRLCKITASACFSALKLSNLRQFEGSMRNYTLVTIISKLVQALSTFTSQRGGPIQCLVWQT